MIEQTIRDKAARTVMGFAGSRLSSKELGLVRVMATGGRKEVARVNEDGTTSIGDVILHDADYGMALSGKLSEHKYVARSGDGGPYYLTSNGMAAAFAPRFTPRTWVTIGLLAAVVAALATIGGTLLPRRMDAPIGSIVACHKNPNPEDSPLRNTGATHMPNLNDSKPRNDAEPMYEGGRFLRGGTTSGIAQDASAVWFFFRHDEVWLFPKETDQFV